MPLQFCNVEFYNSFLHSLQIYYVFSEVFQQEASQREISLDK